MEVNDLGNTLRVALAESAFVDITSIPDSIIETIKKAFKDAGYVNLNAECTHPKMVEDVCPDKHIRKVCTTCGKDYHMSKAEWDKCSSNLVKRLEEVLGHFEAYADHDEYHVQSNCPDDWDEDESITAITQAFKDAGWLTPENAKKVQEMTNMHANMQRGMVRLGLTSTPIKRTADFSNGELSKLMTGQEWYDRFEKALPEPYHTGRELSPYGQETTKQKHASLGEKRMHYEAIYAAKEAAGINGLGFIPN
jgi:NADH:ubiquinone oxidoreductase subunit E